VFEGLFLFRPILQPCPLVLLSSTGEWLEVKFSMETWPSSCLVARAFSAKERQFDLH